jgi:hypothetical protein
MRTHIGRWLLRAHSERPMEPKLLRLLDRRAKLSVHLFSFCRFLSLCDFKDNDCRKNRENHPNRKGIPESHQPDLIGFFATRSFASCASTSAE